MCGFRNGLAAGRSLFPRLEIVVHRLLKAPKRSFRNRLIGKFQKHEDRVATPSPRRPKEILRRRLKPPPFGEKVVYFRPRIKHAKVPLPAIVFQNRFRRKTDLEQM